jgi:hypothetical protein
MTTLDEDIRELREAAAKLGPVEWYTVEAGK